MSWGGVFGEFFLILNIVAGTGDHDTQDDLQADLTPYHVGCRVSPTAVTGVAGTNSYLKNEFVPGDRISKKKEGRHQKIKTLTGERTRNC